MSTITTQFIDRFLDSILAHSQCTSAVPLANSVSQQSHFLHFQIGHRNSLPEVQTPCSEEASHHPCTCHVWNPHVWPLHSPKLYVEIQSKFNWGYDILYLLKGKHFENSNRQKRVLFLLFFGISSENLIHLCSFLGSGCSYCKVCFQITLFWELIICGYLKTQTDEVKKKTFLRVIT